MRSLVLASLLLFSGVVGQVIPPERVYPLFPQLTGWTRGEPDGEVITLGMTMSVARVSYEKGESNISLEVTDTAKNQLLFAAFSLMARKGYAETTGTGYRKAALVGGLPGYEGYDPDGQSAEVAVLVGERFLIKASANGVPDASAARRLVESIDFKALAALK